jgi:hypothetical protein
MKLHGEDQAEHFDTRGECQQWINDRIVRFKLKIANGRDKDGNFACGPLRKTDGRILNTTAEGFKGGGIDEPLSNYAEPVQRDGKWLPVMRVR